jgi:DnaJ-domain-containing protein 1
VVNWPAACISGSVTHAGIPMQKMNARAVTITAVEIVLFDGTSVAGRICVPAQGRVSDVLNDERDFIPVECRSGAFVALVKKAIKQVTLPVGETASYRGSDPYRILGLIKGVPNEEVKKAYHRLCAMHHPDRIKGLGLGDEYEELATRNMVRINSAYTSMLRETAAAA